MPTYTITDEDMAALAEAQRVALENLVADKAADLAKALADKTNELEAEQSKTTGLAATNARLSRELEEANTRLAAIGAAAA